MRLLSLFTGVLAPLPLRNSRVGRNVLVSSLTRVDVRTKKATTTIALGTPGHGGDVGFGGGMVWTTVAKVPLSVVSSATRTLLCQWVGPGGDSLGVGYDSIWLTDYHAGTIERIRIKDALERCIRPSVR